MKTILITGGNGFLGSHLTRMLISQGFSIIATHRSHSDLSRCYDFKKQINWINTDISGWEELIKKAEPQILIHAAWGGVTASDRNDWDLQMANFEFSKKLFDIVVQTQNLEKIIVLGSQAEYGTYNERISENRVPKPSDAYSSIKLLTLHYLQTISKPEFTWHWLRVFSVFGPDENKSWLMPQVINKLKENTPIDLTEGNQCYDYLYIDDFVSNFLKVINVNNKESGVYNFCSGQAVKIKIILELIAKELKAQDELLNFGIIPYRANQSMFMEGDNTKFCKTFGDMEMRKTEIAIHNYIATLK